MGCFAESVGNATCYSRVQQMHNFAFVQLTDAPFVFRTDTWFFPSSQWVLYPYFPGEVTFYWKSTSFQSANLKKASTVTDMEEGGCRGWQVQSALKAKVWMSAAQGQGTALGARWHRPIPEHAQSQEWLCTVIPWPETALWETSLKEIGTGWPKCTILMNSTPVNQARMKRAVVK